ncbi:MAG TPA: hypothetical protein VM261_38900 [Kofleriaceae bacterium]|nr:hypothetical protein [Kofleriaceae bacterium]
MTPIPDEDGDDGAGGGVDGGGGGGGGGMARQLYERDVFPIMTVKCGAGCHQGIGPASTPFVGADVATAYTTLMSHTGVVGNYTTAAPIYALVVPGPHNGRTYTAAEQTKLQTWLAAEAASR